MNAPAPLVQSIRLYFSLFVIASIVVLMLINYKLYSEGEKIRTVVNETNQQNTDREMHRALEYSLNKLQQQIQKIAEWDEVYQQIHDPSYYFFWHDERMKESRYFHPSFTNLEIYNADKKLLMPSSPTKGYQSFLPAELIQLNSQIIFKSFSPAHLNLYKPVYQRGTRELIGYVAISVDVIDYLLRENTFFYVDKTSIHIMGKEDLPAQELFERIQFEPVANPVSEELWELIKNFIFNMFVVLLISAVMMYAIFNVMIYAPIKLLSDYVSRLKRQTGEQELPPAKRFFLKEFERLKLSIFDYHNDLQRTQAELDKQNQIVWEQARRDVLTSIYNRRAFDEAWNDVLYHYTKDPIFTAFILFDCDFFKALNDTYGHEIGDEVIRLTAKTIQDNLPLESPAYRIGGDEFAVIIQNKPLEEVLRIIDKCLNALSRANFNQLGVKESVGFSVGISSTSPSDQNDIASLPRQADIAMYKAKQSLKNKVQTYHEALDKEACSMVSNKVISTIMQAVDSGKGIEMHYQPIVQVDTGRVYYESLVRLRDDEGNMVFPNELFGVIQRSRVEVNFDRQVIKKVVADLASGHIPKHTGISVNISAKTLLQPSFGRLFDPMQRYLSDYKIVIEVTENDLIDHMDYAKQVLNELRDKGFRIALDDFGSGYSSIRYLAHMPVDIIKFDRSLIVALCEGDSSTQKIIRSTAAMILEADYQLVMEGVETDFMFQQSVSSGATHIQGYLLGKPERVPKLVELKRGEDSLPAGEKTLASNMLKFPPQ